MFMLQPHCTPGLFWKHGKMSFLYIHTTRLDPTLMTMATQMITMASSPAGEPREPVIAAAGCNNVSANTRAVARARVFILRPRGSHTIRYSCKGLCKHTVRGERDNYLVRQGSGLSRVQG